jgi:inhibitor of cysteine peptidase
MKKLILTCALLILFLSVFSCSPAPSDVSVEVACDEFYQSPHISRELEVPVGASFNVTLCANPSTGFGWEEAVIGDPALVEGVGREFVGPEGQPPPPPGTPGQEVWTFKALETGQTTLSVDYSRPWEGGEKGEWTFALTLSIK